MNWIRQLIPSQISHKHWIKQKEYQKSKQVTFTAPVWSTSTPTAFKFNLFVLGALPVTCKSLLIFSRNKLNKRFLVLFLFLFFSFFWKATSMFEWIYVTVQDIQIKRTLMQGRSAALPIFVKFINLKIHGTSFKKKIWVIQKGMSAYSNENLI